MSVTFSIGSRVSDEPGRSINLNNRNAADLRVWLGLPTADLWGSVPARELAARCRRRLWPEARNDDPGLTDEYGARFVCFGRPAGYLRQRTEEHLALAELAGDHTISWG